MNKAFWKNKKVFITGHTGFKGTWMSFWLHKMGARVKGYSLPPATDPNMYDLLFTGTEISSVFGDINNLSFLSTEIKDFDPDIVIHMAAQAIVRESYDNPVETFQTNVMGTANLLESVRSLNNVRAVLCITSDKCYENREWHWKYRETDPMGGWDPYSSSKGCSELVVASYRNSFFQKDLISDHRVGIATARAGNVIGGGDWSRDRLIPDCIRAFSVRDEVIIRNPAAIRPWQFILDLLHGYLVLAERLYNDPEEFSEAWNFGPPEEDEKSVEFILNHITSMWGNSAKWRLDEKNNPHEASYLKLDSSMARSRLKWSSQLNLENTLNFLVLWYKEYYNTGNIRQLTSDQIDQFENRLQLQ